MPIIAVIVVILIIVIVFGMGGLIVMNQANKRKERIYRTIQGRAPEKKQASEQDVQNKRRAAMAEKLKDSKDDNPDKKQKTSMSMMLSQAGMRVSVKQFYIFSAIFAALVLMGVKLMGVSPLMMGMIGVIAFFGLPRFVVKRKIAKRQKAFLEEFPDALEASVRLLKAGMPVSEAILMISKEFSGPTGDEMSRIYDQQKIGVPLHEAAQAATKRMPLPEMQMFATGLAIQAQTGASLSEVLMNLSGVIRARFRLKRKVKALSAEAIASASIIGALPNFVAISLYFVNREYIEVLLITPTGQALLVGAVVWMGIGVFVMKLMINFKV